MRGTVFLVGCLGLAVPTTATDVVEIAPEEIRRRSLAGSRLVVVGAAAIERLDADEAWTLLAAVRDRVVLSVQGPVNPGPFAAWLRHGFRFLEPEDVRRRLVLLDARPVRPALSPECWLPCAPTPGSAAEHLVGFVADLPRLTVEAWAQAAGVSRSYVLRSCTGEFGVPARRLLQRHLLAAFDELKRRRHPVIECASVLGFADAATFRRAVRRALKASVAAPSGCKGPPTPPQTAPLPPPPVL